MGKSQAVGRRRACTSIKVEGVVRDRAGRRLELRAHAAQRGGGQRPARAPGAPLARARSAGQPRTGVRRAVATLSCAASVR
jgi:hypothetical protein